MCVCVFGEGGFGCFVLRGNAQPVGVLTKQLLRGGGGKPRPFRPSGQRAARRRAHEATVAAGAGAGRIGRLGLRRTVGFGVDDV